MQLLLDEVVKEGAKYGLEVNWDKTVQLQVSTPELVKQPDSQPVKQVREAVYLGGMICCDGKASRELCRRLGEGRAALRCLARIWSHTGIGMRRKLYIYNTCVISKVLDCGF